MNYPRPQDYPLTIKVLRAKYKIEFDGGMKPRGLTHSKKRVITLDPRLASRELFSTFIHEVIHALEAEYRMTLKHKDVYKLEGAILLLLESNEFLLNTLTRSVKSSKIRV